MPSQTTVTLIEMEKEVDSKSILVYYLPVKSFFLPHTRFPTKQIHTQRNRGIKN